MRGLASPCKVPLALAVVLIATTTACRPAPERPRPNVLIICVDALRPDRLGAYGASKQTSPRIDALASRSAVFENAFSVASWTKPSVPSLLTGLYPSQHEVVSSSDRSVDVLPETVVTLAEVLGGHGYGTGAFVENAHLQRRYSNLDQGFDRYEDEAGTAPEIAHRFLVWLDGVETAPFFAYVHILDPHWPYTPYGPIPGNELSDADRLSTIHWSLSGPRWWRLRRAVRDGLVSLDADGLRTLRKFYDAEIYHTDAVIGRILDALRSRRLLSNTMVILTADHGEGFLEHGNLDHGYGPYDELLRIPLIIDLPGPESPSIRITDSVQLVDVVPTVMDALSLESRPETAGESLVPLMRKRSKSKNRDVFAEEVHGGTKSEAIRTRHYKYIRTERVRGGEGKAHAEIPVELTDGMRVRIQGILVGNRLVADKVVLLSRGDRDCELNGPVAPPNSSRAKLNVLGRDVLANEETTKFDGRSASFRIDGLEVLEWVRVHGMLESGLLHATKIQQVTDVDDQEVEVEGIVVTHSTGRGGAVTFDVCGYRILPGEDALWPNFSDKRRFADPLMRPVLPALSEELYDLEKDPTEQRNIADEQPEWTAEMRSRLDEFKAKLSVSKSERSEVDLDSETRQRLRALGYLD